MLLMLQNLASFTKAPPIFPQGPIPPGWVQTNGSVKYDRSWSDKLQPSIVFDITPQWSIQAGSFFTVAGKNAGREFGPLIGVWYKF
jgi:protein XagA